MNDYKNFLFLKWLLVRHHPFLVKILPHFIFEGFGFREHT